MKKKAKAISLLLCTILFLTGCRAASSESTLVSVPDALPSQQSLTPQAPGTLRLVTDSQEGSDIAVGNENGYYYVDRGGDITANLRYIDYASAQDIYLSARPESDHLTPDDESYISSVAGTGCVFPVGDKLFLLRTGAPSYANTFGDDAMAAVFRMNLDGSNRTQIYLGDASEEFGATAAADDNFLYLIQKQTETTDDSPVDKKYLIQMDQQSGQTERLCEVPYGTTVIGVADGMLIFHSISDSADDENALPVFRHEILAYDVAPGTLSVIQAWAQEEYANTWVYDDMLVTASWASRTVTLRKPREPESIAVYPFADDIPENLIGFSHAGCSNGRFYFFTLKTALCALDLATGEWGRMTLQYDDPEKMEPRPVEIYAETATQYLVLCDKQMTTRRFIYWDDHSIYELEALQPVFALIAKEDYWASLPNYTPVTFNG